MEKNSWKYLKPIDSHGIIVYNNAKVIERNGDIDERRYFFKTSGNHEREK